MPHLSSTGRHRHGRGTPNPDDHLLGAIVVLLVDRALTQWLASSTTQPLARFYLAECARLTDVTTS